MEDRMKGFLFKRTYESALVREKETYSLLDEIIDYGAEKMAEENPPLAAMFPLKLCTMNKVDIGLMLADAMVVHTVKEDKRTIISCKREIIEKMLNISGGVMSFYGRGTIPEDLKMKINFKGIGGTPYYSDPPEKTDLTYYADGFKGHISIEDGKLSYALGLSEDAEDEVSGPSIWIMNLLCGAVDPSEIKEGKGRECVEYMKKAFSNIVAAVIDGYPEHVFLKDEWFSIIKDGWNSDEERVESLKAYDVEMPLDIINISRATSPDDMMDTLLSPLDSDVQKGVVDEGKVRMLISWKDGKVDIRILKPDEEVSHTFRVVLDYEGMTKLTTEEVSSTSLYKTGHLKLIGPGEIILSGYKGLVHLFNHMFNGSLTPIVRRSIKG